MQLGSFVARLFGRGSRSHNQKRSVETQSALSRAAFQALEQRRYFAVQLNTSSSTLPNEAELVEGHQLDFGDDFIVPDDINIDLHFTTDTPSRQHRIIINDGKGSIHDTGIISGPNPNLNGPIFSEVYDDNALITASVLENDGTNWNEVWSDEWEVLNVAPSIPSLSFTTNGDTGHVTVSTFNEPSQTDWQSMHYSFANTYAELADHYSEAGTSDHADLDAGGDADGILWARVIDKDGGFADANTSYQLATVNFDSVTSGLVSFSWSSNQWSQNVYSWTIQRAPFGGTFQTIETTYPEISGSSYTDTTVAEGTRYQYRVRPTFMLGSLGNWSAKQSVSTPWATPTNVHVTSGATSDTATVTWKDNSTDEDGFQILQSVNNGSFVDIATVEDATSYELTDLAPNSRYTIQLIAIGNDAPSYASATASFQTTPFVAPLNATAHFDRGHKNSGEKLSITFSEDVTGLDHSDIYIDSLATGDPVGFSLDSYDALSHTATISFTKFLPESAYQVRILKGSVASASHSLGQDLNEVFYALTADADQNGWVNNLDLYWLATHFPAASGASYHDGDFDRDGDVDGSDLDIWTGNQERRLDHTFDAVAISSSAISLSWDDTATAETEWIISRSDDGGITFHDLDLHAPADPTEPYVDSDLQEGTTYWYQVRAIGATNSPAFSLKVSASTPATPTISTPPQAQLSLDGTSAMLDVLGSVPEGEAYLTYNWSATYVQPGAEVPIFDENGTNAAKNTNVTFFKAGEYHFAVTIDNNGATITSGEVVVTVGQTLSSISVTPGFIDLSDFTGNGVQQQLQAIGEDQFGDPMDDQPDNFSWSTDNPNAIISSSTLPHSTGRGLSEGDVDPYWTVDGQPAIVTHYYPGWLSPGSEGRWISFAQDSSTDDTVAGPVDRVYGTLVNLTAMNGVISISGHLAADNEVRDILVNGQSTGFTYSGVSPNDDGHGFSPECPFTLSTEDYLPGTTDPLPLVEGVNSIEFVVRNDQSASANPTGLVVYWESAALAASVSGSGVAGSGTVTYSAPRLSPESVMVSAAIGNMTAYATVNQSGTGVHRETIGSYNVKAIPTNAFSPQFDLGADGWISKFEPDINPVIHSPLLYDAFLNPNFSILDGGQFFGTGHTISFNFAAGALGDGSGSDLAIFNGGWSKDGYEIRYYWKKPDGTGGQTAYNLLPETKTAPLGDFVWPSTGITADYWRGHYAIDERYDPNLLQHTTVLAYGIDFHNVIPSDAFVYRVDLHVTNGLDTADLFGLGSLNFAPPVIVPPPATVPNAPTNPTAVVSGTQVNLSWTDASSDETGFTIQRQVGSGMWETLTPVGAGTTTYSDKSVSAGETYFYRVSARNDNGSSVFSNIVSVSMPGTPPAPPTPPSPPTISSISLRMRAAEADDRAGAILDLNDDDDDNNGVADWTQKLGMINGVVDNDLVPFDVGGSGNMTLSSSSSRQTYRVYENQNRTGCILGYGVDGTSATVTGGRRYWVEARSAASGVMGALRFLLTAQGPVIGPSTRPVKATVRDVDVLIGADDVTDTSIHDDWVGMKVESNVHSIRAFVRYNGPAGTSIPVTISRVLSGDGTVRFREATVLGNPVGDAVDSLSGTISADNPLCFNIEGRHASSKTEDVAVQVARNGETIASETLTVLRITLPDQTYGDSPIPLNPAVVNDTEASVGGNLFGASNTAVTPKPNNKLSEPEAWPGFCYPNISGSTKISPDKIEIAWGRKDYTQTYRGSTTNNTLDVRPIVSDLTGGYRTGFRMRDNGSFPAVPNGTEPIVTYFLGHPSGETLATMRMDGNFAASITGAFYPHVTVPVYVHILKGPTMNGGVNMTQVTAMFNDVNKLWSQAGRSFNIIGSSVGGAAGVPETLATDELLDVWDRGPNGIGELDDVTDINEQSNAVDVYFVSKIFVTETGTRKEATGSTIMPDENPLAEDPGILIAGQGPQFNSNANIRAAQMARTISHEFGHYLSKVGNDVHDPDTKARLMSSGVSDSKRDLEGSFARTVRQVDIKAGSTG